MTWFAVQAGRDWFSTPLAFIPMGSENLNSLLIPSVAAVASGTLLVAHILSYSWNKSRRNRNTTEGNGSTSVAANEETRSNRFGHKINQHARNHGGLVIFGFKIARLMGCLALFSLSIATLVDSGHSTHQGRIILDWDGVFSADKLPQITMVVTFWYTSSLAIFSLVHNSWSRSVTRHSNFVLFVALAVYVYRDIWPLATYTEKPVDASEGTLLWIKLIVLFTIAMIIPLLVPRQYVPVDPKHPMEVPNPEQTASVLSLITYSFLDPLIFEAFRVPHLSHEQLPAMADYDRANYLREKAFPYLDPFQDAKGHLFFRLLKVFRVESIWMSFAAIFYVLASFASPLAMNKILSFIESDGQGASINPWLWVLCLLIGPIIMSICSQWYAFMGRRALACTESLLTQLVFEHSLRIRFKAEKSKEDDSPTVQSVDPGTPSTLEGSDSQSDITISSTKGKARADTSTIKSAQDEKKEENLIGRINTLVTVDLDNVIAAKDFLMISIQVPLELVLAVIFLYAVLGWSAFIGCASIVVLLPVPGYLAVKMQAVQRKKMTVIDARVQAVTETMGVLRMVKLFGWEHKMSETIKRKRDEELIWIWKDKMITLLTDIANYFAIPTISMLVTFGTYTLIMKQSLNASKVFSSMAVFEIVRNLLHRTSNLLMLAMKGKVSLDRFSSFLRDTELLDSFSEEQVGVVNDTQHDIDDRIGFNNAVFAWSKEDYDGTETPSSRTFRLRVEGNVTFKRNCINLIIGPTGSGKTSILMALLGEMHFIPSTMDSWYNLPRRGGIAYAAQESWVQNETIRENILFGSPYDEERYQKVIYQCALKHDLELFGAGDSTEVGEKGLTLSGGQKARVTLARAIYSSAEIILLDDVLAALDVHTSKWIVNECLQGDLVRGRTILLVTHNVALTAPIAGSVVSIGLDGIPHVVGFDISAVLENDLVLARKAEAEEEESDVVVDDVNKKEQKSDGKLILAEEIVEGRITWRAIKLFWNSLGGEHPFLFMAVWMAGLAATQVALSFGTWFLGYWGSQYENHLPEQVRDSYYLSCYALILVAFLFIYLVVTMFYNSRTLRASRSINEKLVDSVFGSTLRWLDETPTSRIVTRCTQDIATVDGDLSWNFAALVELSVSMAIKIGAPVLLTPSFLLPSVLIAVLGVYISNIYLKAQMSVKRETSNAKSPVLAHFGVAVAGLVSIRAYNAQQHFKTESMKRIDHYVKVARTSYNLYRWIGVRIDALGATFTAALASYILVNRSLNAANIGFSLIMAIDLCSLILWLVGSYNEFEVQSNSLERIQGYLDIEHEPKPTEAGIPPAAWPTSGELHVEHLSARYSATGPKALHDLSFHVKSGERIGIVGRTGSGKSSLTLSLLRCILTEGSVCYDGIPTNKINLDALRSSITVIPQSPELLSGTLRRNLDPFDHNDDATLNDALRASGFFSIQTDAVEARLTLDSDISNGGNNLSVGQRQVIALARAMVRNSKLLILDEATSAIDHETDSVIQSSLRTELGSDVTILTVAHRLQTIMDADKIMVLDGGKIIEFDSPQELLQKKGGAFKSMVDGSGDKKSLYAMADRKGGK